MKNKSLRLNLTYIHIFSTYLLQKGKVTLNEFDSNENILLLDKSKRSSFRNLVRASVGTDGSWLFGSPKNVDAFKIFMMVFHMLQI